MVKKRIPVQTPMFPSHLITQEGKIQNGSSRHSFPAPGVKLSANLPGSKIEHHGSKRDSVIRYQVQLSDRFDCLILFFLASVSDALRLRKRRSHYFASSVFCPFFSFLPSSFIDL
ncbi:hypothetical protein N431DRAFT_135209 [Stipitochalara longipes BDJ]|nr:hypothetical protein N431DRAFT_135209 [Stipitochalara longipes BDJ]